MGFACAVRLHPGEKQDSEGLGEGLAALCDVYINDAFGAIHRKHSSLHAAPKAAAAKLKPTLAGFLLLKELEALRVSHYTTRV